MRYAVYYAPRPDDPLHAFARRWLRPEPDDVIARNIDDATRRHITAEPRRYGVHGTLKPPFALAQGCSEAMLTDAISAFAASRRSFLLPPLGLARIGRFLALVPRRPCGRLRALADDCVRAFDAFRAPPAAAELERRRAGGLTARQDALLVEWGYPYVLDEFRFHLTLTESLAPDELRIVETALRDLVEPMCRGPRLVSDLCLFVEPAPGEDFRLLRRFPLRPA